MAGSSDGERALPLRLASGPEEVTSLGENRFAALATEQDTVLESNDSNHGDQETVRGSNDRDDDEHTIPEGRTTPRWMIDEKDAPEDSYVGSVMGEDEGSLRLNTPTPRFIAAITGVQDAHAKAGWAEQTSNDGEAPDLVAEAQARFAATDGAAAAAKAAEDAHDRQIIENWQDEVMPDAPTSYEEWVAQGKPRCKTCRKPHAGNCIPELAKKNAALDMLRDVDPDTYRAWRKEEKENKKRHREEENAWLSVENTNKKPKGRTNFTAPRAQTTAPAPRQATQLMSWCDMCNCNHLPDMHEFRGRASTMPPANANGGLVAPAHASGTNVPVASVALPPASAPSANAMMAPPAQQSSNNAILDLLQLAAPGIEHSSAFQGFKQLVASAPPATSSALTQVAPIAPVRATPSPAVTSEPRVTPQGQPGSNFPQLPNIAPPANPAVVPPAPVVQLPAAAQAWQAAAAAAHDVGRAGYFAHTQDGRGGRVARGGRGRGGQRAGYGGRGGYRQRGNTPNGRGFHGQQGGAPNGRGPRAGFREGYRGTPNGGGPRGGHAGQG
ncbi:hypothetical protein B0A48_08946 [Cryoendolithus antarcticus]|uniref:Uncharacterized protein n=1 Tax=Cryoendolithus antarcticus TaxID=1507870 RepID=A0A1V8T4K7_9PEZI|nr:hypothetical protein B0A48_08946 [Cryoendolithus antarcticus]